MQTVAAGCQERSADAGDEPVGAFQERAAADRSQQSATAAFATGQPPSVGSSSRPPVPPRPDITGGQPVGDDGFRGRVDAIAEQIPHLLLGDLFPCC
jgi:hypothetical protein